jgi:Family of unknown function (DUF6328)
VPEIGPSRISPECALIESDNHRLAPNPSGSVQGPPDYSRDEEPAHQLDRNWSELVQELRVIGTGVQILFAFLLSIAFQARFARTSSFQRDVYLVTLLFSGLAVAFLIAPVALHRFLFRLRVKDEVVIITNWLAVFGLGVLSMSMIGAIVLVSDWVAGTSAAVIWGIGSAVVFGAAWFAGPVVLRRRNTEALGGIRRSGREK